MAKWDIDKSLKGMEPESCPGTTIQRVLLDVKLLTNPETKLLYGKIVPTPAEVQQGCLNVWSVGIGFSYEPKAVFYGRTIREAFLQARRTVKLGKLDRHTPWGRQVFTPVLPKAKRRDRRSSRSRTVSPD